MEHFWNGYWHFWSTMDLNTLVRWAWFVFLFDIPRFVIVEGFALFWAKRTRASTKKQWEAAREELFRENPLVTVLVPGHNEGRHLYKLVESMKRQTYQNTELIVVCDGSTDDTPMIGRSFEKSGYIDLFLRAEERGGKASAANLGLRYSKGEYIIHLDADSSLEDDAVEKILIPFFRYDNVGAVGGNLMVRNDEDSLTSTLQFMEYMQSISTSRIVLSTLGIYKMVSGAFGAFPREVLNRIGGWDIGPGLDGDITVKIRKIGYRIVFEEEALCKTHVPITWKALAKQRLRWSRSLVRFRIRKHKDIWLPDRNFNFSNFLAFFDNVFFALILDFLWVYYMVRIFVLAPSFFPVVLMFNYTIYLAITTISYFYSLATTKNYKKKVWRNFIYVPLYPIYMGYYMRIVRTTAYVREFLLYDSYNDAWNPQKTSKKAKEFGM